MSKKEETYPIWINPTDLVLSFHFEQSFELLRFPTIEAQMDFARKMSRQGYRVQ